MPSGSCPGSDGRFITANDVRCPGCGAMVEIFSDEMRRKCPECGERVTRDAVPICAAWCASARSCLGAARYDELRNAGMLELGPTSDAEPEKG